MQQAIAPGTVIAKRYQIQKKIPDTTSNICYLAEDTDQSNRLVVISFPRMELQTLPGFASTFDDACQRLIKARLSGLIKVLDHGEHESQPYAVLQYVTHESLEASLVARKNQSKKVSVDEVLDWARPLAVTLDELHEMDYVHSNVRPSVIFLGQKRQVLLGDFITELAIQRLGASKQAISSLDISDHLAPEYIKSTYNESYDQYLLATIVYQALAGRSHFHNPGSSEAYRRQVATKFPEPLLSHRPELVGASRILGKALERNPVKRFDSCREFVNQLGSAQVNPVFGATDDKPQTVIKKVLDLDETAPADPIITSIRSNKGRGRKKGLIWLGVLLLGTGAGAYAVNHFGGLEQFKTKLSTAWNDLSEDKAKPSVIVPVDISANIPVSNNGAVAEVKDNSATAGSTSTESVDVSTKSPENTNTASSTAQSSVNNQNQTQSSNVTSQVVDADPKTDSVSKAPAEASGTNENTTTAINSSQISRSEVSTDNTAVAVISSSETTAGIASTVTKSGSAGSAISGVDELVLSNTIRQALSEGQAEFISSQAIAAKAGETKTTASVAKVDEAISKALQQAQVDFMRQTSPATSQESGASLGVEGSSAVENPVSGDEVVTSSPESTAQTAVTQQTVSEANPVVDISGSAESTDAADSVVAGSTEENTPLSSSEIEAQNLNEQMVAANKLADERAETARQAVEQKKREREELQEARKKAREEAKQKVREEALKKAQEEARKKREEDSVKENAAKEQARAREVVSAPVAKSFDQMQKERARIQVIKAQKTARINSITKDCVTSGKIHRQVAAGNLPYVKNCLSVGVNANLTQSNRWSLLHLASRGGYLNMAKLLAAKGADINAKAANGKTPLDMAIEQKQERLVTYLRSRGGVTTR